MTLKEIRGHFIKAGFLKNVLTLATGTTIAQLIPIGLQPVLRRMFSPSEFGGYAIFLSIVEIIVVFGTLRYELAIVLPKKRSDAINLTALTLIAGLLINVIILIVILLFSHNIALLVNLPANLEYWLYLIPVTTFLFGICQSINYWLIREKAFFPSTVNKLFRRGFEGASQLVFGVMRSGSGLVFGTIIGHIANFICNLFQLKNTKFDYRLISSKRMLKLTKNYSEFPVFATVPALLNILSLLLPVFFINKFYTDEATGYFDLSRQVLLIPLALIASSISQVLLQQITERKNKNESIYKLINRIVMMLTAASVAGVAIMIFFGVDIFVFIFGKNWANSGEISRILSINFAVKFIVLSIFNVLLSLGKIKLMGLWQAFNFAIILLLLFFRNYTFDEFIKIYAIIDTASYLICLIMIYVVIDKYEKTLRKNSII